MKEIHRVEDALDVILRAFERYRCDEKPSSALMETVQSVRVEMNDGMKLYGIQEKNEWIGVVKYVQNQDVMYFSRLAVLPHYQGNGIATALIRSLEKQALKNGLSRSRCKVRKREMKNISLYAKLGYAIVEESVIMNTNGDRIETLTMEKQLVK